VTLTPARRAKEALVSRSAAVSLSTRRSRLQRFVVPAVVALAASFAAVVGTTSSAEAYPPEPPDAATSLEHLNAITEAAEGSMDGYDRDLFPHWINIEGSCDTREMVLQRDGTGVTTGSDCYPTDGDWYSVYDQVWFSEPSDVSIDHMIPLAEAWRSGASGWTTDQRQTFANDLEHAQLIAVSISSNSSKGDSDPAVWKPPNTGMWCYYVRYWIDVKYVYGLTADAAEKAALGDMLSTC
jgi:Protein of unknown function (DUF1524)